MGGVSSAINKVVELGRRFNNTMMQLWKSLGARAWCLKGKRQTDGIVFRFFDNVRVL